MIHVIDDFFDDPDLIRDYAMTVKYETPTKLDNWKGFRTNYLTTNTSIEKSIIENVNDALVKFIKLPIKLDICFHFSPQFIMQDVNNFHEYKYHKDSSDYAGVIYLTPNPPENSGTCIKDFRCIKNVYNRFLMYPGNLIHGPDHLFGYNLSNTRLTVTFFAELY